LSSIPAAGEIRRDEEVAVNNWDLLELKSSRKDIRMPLIYPNHRTGKTPISPYVSNVAKFTVLARVGCHVLYT